MWVLLNLWVVNVVWREKLYHWDLWAVLQPCSSSVIIPVLLHNCLYVCQMHNEWEIALLYHRNHRLHIWKVRDPRWNQRLEYALNPRQCRHTGKKAVKPNVITYYCIYQKTCFKLFAHHQDQMESICTARRSRFCSRVISGTILPLDLLIMYNNVSYGRYSVLWLRNQGNFVWVVVISYDFKSSGDRQIQNNLCMTQCINILVHVLVIWDITYFHLVFLNSFVYLPSSKLWGITSGVWGSQVGN